jgi:hypothetical protein
MTLTTTVKIKIKSTFSEDSDNTVQFMVLRVGVMFHFDGSFVISGQRLVKGGQ